MPLTVEPILSMRNSVQAGQTYYYVVTALDSTNQESTYSSEIAAAVP
jgi:fibronectin type 3 domain-containing protein